MQEISSTEKELACCLYSLLDDFLWRKQLSKVADIVLSLPFNDKVWPLENHENLIFVIFNFCSHQDMEATGNSTCGWVQAEDARVVGEEGGIGRESLARTLVSVKTLEKMWCESYYYVVGDAIFPLTKPQEEECFDLTQSEDK